MHLHCLLWIGKIHLQSVHMVRYAVTIATSTVASVALDFTNQSNLPAVWTQPNFYRSFNISNIISLSISPIWTHAGSHPPWDVGEWYCSPSVDSVSASLPGCCSSNSDAVARSIRTLHRCQTWAGGEEGRKHIHTHACTPCTQKHTHTRTQTHTHRHTHRSDLSLVFWCTILKFNVVEDTPDMNYILKRHCGNSQKDTEHNTILWLRKAAAYGWAKAYNKRREAMRYKELPRERWR